MMRRYEAVFLMFLFFGAAACAGAWLWTEIGHYRAAVLVEQTLTGKIPGSTALIGVLTDFSRPCREKLPGKPIFYKSTLAIVAEEKSNLPASTRLQWLKKARAGLSAELMREPANSYAWFHLADTILLLEGPGQGVMEALRMSIYTSPAEKQLLMGRLKMAGLVRDFWDADFRDLLVGQVVLPWRLVPRSFTKMARASHIEDLVREALSDDPKGLALFEALCRNIHAPLN